MDTILEVETAAKRLLKEAIQKKALQILQQEFLLELDQWPTDEEMDSSEDLSNEDMTEPEDSTGDLTPLSEDEDMEWQE